MYFKTLWGILTLILELESFFKKKKEDTYGQEHLSRAYRAWRDHLTRCIDEYLPTADPYALLHSASLVGLFTCVFIKAPLRPRIREVYATEVKTGMGGLHGNKVFSSSSSAILNAETLTRSIRALSLFDSFWMILACALSIVILLLVKRKPSTEIKMSHPF